MDCFNRHKAPRKGKGLQGREINESPMCEVEWKCTTCHIVMEYSVRSRLEHKCGDWKCQCCYEYFVGDQLLLSQKRACRAARQKVYFLRL